MSIALNLARTLMFSAAVLLSACDLATQKALDQEVVADDFSRSGAQALARYRTVWEGYQLSEIDRAMLAGELVAVDTGRSEEYYTYIRQAAGSADDDIAAAAAGALRNVSDDTAVGILVELARSDRAPLARAAAHSLSFKRQQVRGGSLSGHEAQLIERRITGLCEELSLAPYVRDLACSRPQSP